MKAFLFCIPVVIILFLNTILSTGCKKKGCTDGNALNFNSKAQKDDYTCKFSTVNFYALDTDIYFCDTTVIELFVDNQYVGKLKGGIHDTTDLCTSDSTFAYSLQDGLSHHWKVLLKCWAQGNLIQLINEGNVQANRNESCKNVRIL